MEAATDTSLAVICAGEKATDVAVKLGLTATTNAGGEKAVKQTDWVPLLRFETVVVVIDNDAAGERFGQLVAAALFKLKPDAKVRIIRLPGLPPQGDIVEWIAAGGGKGKFLALVNAAATVTIEKAAGWIKKPSKANGLPEIDAAQQHLPTITQEAWDAIRESNRPERLFRYGGHLMRTETGDEGELVLRQVNLDRMRYEATNAAYWFKWAEGEDGEKIKVDAQPHDKVVKNMLATADIDLPRLTRIVEAPVFAPDGTIQTEPGYHERSRTYYAPSKGLVVPDVPTRPTRDDLARATSLLWCELMGDFPFIGDAEKSHAMALALQPFARDLIDGCTPLYLFEKPTPGTGATLLVSEIVFIATGRPLLAMTEGRDEDEWRKRLTAKLRTGAGHIVIDNLGNRLDSPALSAAITAPTWEDRILGVSETAKIPIRCCWVATGNNPAVSSEIARRTVRVRMDAKIDRPWERTAFRHPDLHGWAQGNRGELVWAALVMIQSWIDQGKPDGQANLGGFEAWSRVLGGILAVAGIPGFLDNASEFYDASDEEGTALRTLIEAWWAHHKETPKKAGELWPMIYQDDLKLDLGDGNKRSQKTRFGKLIGRLRDRMFRVDVAEEDEQPDTTELVRVESAGTFRRASLRRLRRIEKQNPSEVV
ncbi:MAG: hypothetical protein ABIK89_13220 [Planctomycetota bacterium]